MRALIWFLAVISMLFLSMLLMTGHAVASPAHKVIPSADELKVSAVKASEYFSYGRFGEMAIYLPKKDEAGGGGVAGPSDLVLFISGEKGWNEEMASMAQDLAARGALVAGIDITRLYQTLESNKEQCTYPAADFEGLAHALEEHYRFPAYRYPYLVGYRSGAALAYAMLAQAPEGTFAGALSLGFCPEIGLRVPLCESDQLKRTVRTKPLKGFDLLATAPLSAPWIVLQDEKAQACSPDSVAEFIKKVSGTALQLSKDEQKGEPRSAETSNGMPPHVVAYERLRTRASPVRAMSATDAPSDLPLTEVTTTVTAKPDNIGAGSFAIILTGDGGWAGLDREVAAALSARGIPVVGFSTLQYFWRVKTPEQTGKDLERVMRYYLHQWQKQSVILIGYSMGAEVLPFAVNRLSAEMQARVVTVGAIAPGRTAEFEFHFSNWVPAPAGSSTRDLPIEPEVEKLIRPFTCIYPKEEQDSLCPVLDAKRYRIAGLPGGHHFDGDYNRLVQIILEDKRPALR